MVRASRHALAAHGLAHSDLENGRPDGALVDQDDAYRSAGV